MQRSIVTDPRHHFNVLCAIFINAIATYAGVKLTEIRNLCSFSQRSNCFAQSIKGEFGYTEIRCQIVLILVDNIVQY